MELFETFKDKVTYFVNGIQQLTVEKTRELYSEVDNLRIELLLKKPKIEYKKLISFYFEEACNAYQAKYQIR